MAINVTTFSGNVCQDPELSATPSGTSILNFSVAVNERKKESDGTWSDYPNYIRCTVFGNRADALERILTKGVKVCCTGNLHQERWKDKETGKGREKIVVYVRDVDLMSKPAAKNDAEPALYFDDLPF